MGGRREWRGKRGRECKGGEEKEGWVTTCCPISNELSPPMLRNSLFSLCKMCNSNGSQKAALCSLLGALSTLWTVTARVRCRCMMTNLRQARLVLGWVIVAGFNSQCRTFISVCNQPPGQLILPSFHGQ